MIRIESVVVPVDFSESSEKAVRYGVEIARERKAKLVILHVINQRILDSIHELSVKGYKGDFVEAVKNMIHNRHEDLHAFVPESLRSGLDMEFVIRKGRPATEIVKFTRENNTDLVIVGVKGRSALEVVFLGSVARDVVNHAPCPVLVVRPVEHDFIE